MHLFCTFDDLRCGKVRIIDNTNLVPSTEGRIRLEAEGIRSFVIVPLLAEGNLIGSLNFGSGQSNAFSVDEIEIAKELANSLAVAIRHAHLNRQIESHAAQLEQRVAERTDELSRANASLRERIAERERAECTRRESEERLAAVLRTTMDAILVIDSHQRIVIFNEAAEKVFSCSSSEATGRDVSKFLTDDFASVLNSYIATVTRRAAKQFWIPDGLRALRADGEPFPIEATMSRVEVAGEELFTIILRDINERKQAEAKLEQLERTNLYLQEELQTELNFENIIGSSPVMQKVFNSIEMVAGTDSTVLLLGATGTGKELIAHALHNHSRRRGNAIIKVNCAALPASLVESELFGHERGAFTGAVALKKGRFELADGGTIFLDEVGELSPDTQTKLLRVLQEQEFERVGGSRTLKVDVRVIAATNRDLTEEVFRGAFRSDLFYRLNVFPIEVPPLHKRKEDIPVLAAHFALKFSHRMNKRIQGISKEAYDLMQRNDWPGNVRELATLLERAVILCSGPIIQSDHLVLSTPRPSSIAGPELLPTLEDSERKLIVQALEQTNGVLAGPNGAAQLLGVNRSTLWSRMRKLGILLPNLRKMAQSGGP
jgi:PAS domain S-box-containing protein